MHAFKIYLDINKFRITDTLQRKNKGIKNPRKV